MSSRLPVGYRFYWDDQCRLCNTLKAVAQKLDWGKRCDFLPLTSEPAELDLAHLNLDERFSSSHLVTPEGRVYSRGKGILALARLLPLTAPLVFFFHLLPASERLAEKLYDLVAQNRGVPYGGSCQIKFADLDHEE